MIIKLKYKWNIKLSGLILDVSEPLVNIQKYFGYLEIYTLGTDFSKIWLRNSKDNGAELHQAPCWNS